MASRRPSGGFPFKSRPSLCRSAALFLRVALRPRVSAGTLARPRSDQSPLAEPDRVDTTFRALCADIVSADLAGDGSVDKFEEPMFVLIEFARRNLTERRPEIVSCFAALLEGEIEAPEEFLLLAMHELRL